MKESLLAKPYIEKILERFGMDNVNSMETPIVPDCKLSKGGMINVIDIKVL